MYYLQLLPTTRRKKLSDFRICERFVQKLLQKFCTRTFCRDDNKEVL